jgi:formate hydrogenlyase subunit 6/NADH:ubiquinone oxidoreductase subunit I
MQKDVGKGTGAINETLQPQIAEERCTGCERCVDICPTQALAQINDKAVLLFPDRCTYCTACEDVCPTNAIALPFLIVFADDVHWRRSDSHYGGFNRL